MHENRAQYGWAQVAGSKVHHDDLVTPPGGAATKNGDLFGGFYELPETTRARPNFVTLSHIVPSNRIGARKIYLPHREGGRSAKLGFLRRMREPGHLQHNCRPWSRRGIKNSNAPFRCSGCLGIQATYQQDGPGAVVPNLTSGTPCGCNYAGPAESARSKFHSIRGRPC